MPPWDLDRLLADKACRPAITHLGRELPSCGSLHLVPYRGAYKVIETIGSCSIENMSTIRLLKTHWTCRWPVPKLLRLGILDGHLVGRPSSRRKLSAEGGNRFIRHQFDQWADIVDFATHSFCADRHVFSKIHCPDAAPVDCRVIPRRDPFRVLGDDEHRSALPRRGVRRTCGRHDKMCRPWRRQITTALCPLIENPAPSFLAGRFEIRKVLAVHRRAQHRQAKSVTPRH